jgi:hypothetical protein
VYEYVRVVEFGQVHKRTLRVLGLEPLEDRRRVPSLTNLAVDLWWFWPLASTQLQVAGVQELLLLRGVVSGANMPTPGGAGTTLL